ncbi:MAG: hypothetical protein M1829_004749 [Trizodia sp. TS-e1964]|nr:MAG: hypothetical protein M1829_004749 [Trizodia sp. TS-e1964]
MVILRGGGTAVDAVEMAVKVLEDQEITNAGFGSNLAIDGVVECDATIVDHFGRSGAVGAVSQIKNPISLARVVLQRSLQPLSLRRVPPNLLVSQGAVDFAFEEGLPVLPHDALIAPGARERWLRWREELRKAENYYNRNISDESYPDDNDIGTDNDYEELVRQRQRKEHTRLMETSLWNNNQQGGKPSRGSNISPWNKGAMPSAGLPLAQSVAESPRSIDSPSFNHNFLDITSIYSPGSFGHSDHEQELADAGKSNKESDTSNVAQQDGSPESGSPSSLASLCLPSLTPSPPCFSELIQSPLSGLVDSPADSEPLHSSGSFTPETPSKKATDRDDHITDTVGAIAFDIYGNIAAGSSSGGIGMKHRGRVGPAALVGVGSSVIPVDPDDPECISVATVTSGTGEHMATTMASAKCAERLYFCNRKAKGGGSEDVDENKAMMSMVDKDFMGHPGVRANHSAGAIGILAVKRSKYGAHLYFVHNTDSFVGDDLTPILLAQTLIPLMDRPWLRCIPRSLNLPALCPETLVMEESLKGAA